MKTTIHKPSIKEILGIIMLMAILIGGQVQRVSFLTRTIANGERVMAEEYGLDFATERGWDVSRIESLPVSYGPEDARRTTEVVFIQFVKDKVEVKEGGTYLVAIDPSNHKKALLVGEDITMQDYKPWMNLNMLLIVLFSALAIMRLVLSVRRNSHLHPPR